MNNMEEEKDPLDRGFWGGCMITLLIGVTLGCIFVYIIQLFEK